MSASSGNFPLTFRLQVQGDAEIANKFKNLATTLNQVTPATQKVAQGSKQAETALKSTGQAATSSTTGLKSYHGSLTSLGSANSAAAKGTEAFTGSLTSFSTANKAAVGGLTETNTVTNGLVPTMSKLGNEGTKTQSKMQKLTDVFQGNKGLIFSTTMLSSGIFEAIGMYQGWQDASEKLAAAKEKEADLIARGLEGTKEYGDAVNEVSDAQRGYNFITRFTIQSFADLIPMSLMLTSSLLGMVGQMGGLTTAKTKLAAAGSKLVGVMQTLGTALMTFTTRHPLLAMLTLAAAAVIALIKNFMGFRDAVNAVGVELGKIIPQLQGALEWLGFQGNAALDTADSFLTYGTKAAEASTDVEKAVLKTGDATVMSADEQIVMMGKLGDEAGEMAFTLGAHLKKQEQDEASHNVKYKQFVEAMTTGNDDIISSLGLTADQFQDFSKQFQDEVAAMDEAWNTGVESIMENWASVNEGFGESVDSTVGEIIKLEDKITELTAQQWELDDKKALEKNRQEIAKNQAKIDELRGTTGRSLGMVNGLFDIFGNTVQMNVAQKITPAMEQAGRDFIALGKAATDGVNAIRNGILAQDFQGAINSLSMAIDSVPAKYQGNFAKIDAILGNSALTQRQKVSEIVDVYGSMENAFKPLIVGAYELDRTNALLATSLDEVAVAARQNMTDMSGAEGAWNKFLGALTPAQKNLPMIEDLVAKVNAGVITHEEALKRAEAAGRSWSALLGKDVATSIKNVSKQIIDMGDGTSKVFGVVNGLMVDLGRVSNTELGNVTNDTKVLNTAMSKTGQTAQQSLENEATAAVGVFGQDGQFHFGTVVKGANNTIDVFKAVNLYADRYVAQGATAKVAGLGTQVETTGTTIKNESNSWSTSFEGFATAVAGAFNTIKEALNTPIDLGAAATAIVDSLTNALTKEAPKLLDQGKELVGQVAKGIMDFAATVQPAAEATINHFVTGTQKKYQEIVKVGGAIVDQVSKGITQFAKTIGPSAEGVVNNFVTGIQKVAQTVLTAGKGLVTQIGSGIEQLFPQLKTKGNASATTFRDGVVANFKVVIAAGKGVITNLIAGMKQTIDTIKTTLMKPFQDAKTAIEGLFKGWDPLGALGGLGKMIMDALPKIPGASADKGDGGGGGQIPVVPATKVDYDITPAISKLDQLKAYVTQTTTQISAMFLTMGQSIKLTLSQIPPAAQLAASNISAAFITMETSIKGTVTRITAIFPTMFTTLPTLAMTATSQTSAAFITMLSSITGTTTQIKAQIVAMQGVFSTLSTSVSTYMTSMSTKVAAFGVAAITAISNVSKNVLVAQGVFSTFSTSVSTYMTSMGTKISGFATTTTSAMNKVVSATKSAHSTLSSMSTSVSTYMSSMSSKVNSFGSAASSAFNKVGSAASSATSKVKQLQSAINALKSKTITITVRYNVQGKPSGLEHGGSFLSHGQKGFQGIVDTPTTFKGVRMGEGRKPELVTVTPLTRGTGNNTGGPTVSSGKSFGGGGGQPVEIHIHNEIGGREVNRYIKKVSLEDFGNMV